MSERFKVEPYWRGARRGPAARVKDGWLLADTLTGSVRRLDTKADVEKRIVSILRREEEIPRETVAWWDADLEYRSHTTDVEVSLFDADGERLGSFAVVERALAPQRVAEWLRAVRLEHLPRLARVS